MAEGGTTNEINKLYFDLLVSKNKLPILQTYYSNIKNKILTDLTDLFNDVRSMHAWVDSQINYLNNSRTEQATATNDFIASSSDNLIVSHPKYQEMMDRYSDYVTKFYSRIHSLENEGISNSYTVNNFINNEIGQVSSYWKFHYSDQYSNASPVEHKFCAINITSESDILELSNSRYIYITNENVLYDVDYTTKDIYIYYLDNKIIPNITEESAFHSLFTVKDKNKIYIFVITKKMSNADLSLVDPSEIVGNANDDSGVYEVKIFKYDDVNFAISEVSGASTFYIEGNILFNDKLKVVESNSIKDFYYAYIDNSIIRFRLLDIGENEETDIADFMNVKVHTFNNKITNVVEFNNRLVFPENINNNNTRLVAYGTTSNGSIDLLNLFASITFNSFPENDPRFNTDNQIVNIFKSDNIGGANKVGIYVVTNSNIWYFDSITPDNKFDVRLDTRKNRVGIADYSFLENKGLYLIDEFGYLYMLRDNIYLYCAKTDESATELYGNVVQAPTRYADRLINLRNIISEDRLGYVFNKTDNITSSQLTDQGYDDFIYNFINKRDENDKGILYCITKTGKIAYCNIETGEWNFNDPSKHCYASFTNNIEITAIYENVADSDLYIALSNYAILKVNKDELVSKLGYNLYSSNLVYNTGSGSRINAMVYIPAYKVLYMADRSGYVSAYDFNNNTYHTADITSRDYSELDKTKYAITKGDNAIGNVSINCITTDGNNLIVMGDFGRVSSCSLSTFKWTPYNTVNENISQYDSNIFFNGRYTDNDDTVKTNGNIVSFINYNNGKLIVFTNLGEVFSCNLSTGVWTNSIGKIVLHNGSGFGPGIYDNGSASNNKSLKTVIRIGTVAFVTGESGRIFSIDLVNGGITGYKGSNTNVLVGPGYFYTGEDIAENTEINAIVSDNRGKIFISGSNNVAFTFSIENNELLVPTTSKLYYIARRQTRFDYLSSLLVRVSKGELSEKVPMYPPSEDEEVFGTYFQSSSFIFKNGKRVWKINNALDICYVSDDNGISFTTITNIHNEEVLPLTNDSGTVEYVQCMPRGVVTKNGDLYVILNIGRDRNTYLLYSRNDELYWYKFEKYYNQESIDSLKYAGITSGDSDIIAIMNENSRYDVYSIKSDNSIIRIDGMCKFVSYNETSRKSVFIDTDDNDGYWSKLTEYINNKFDNYDIDLKNLCFYTNENDMIFLVGLIGDSSYELHIIDFNYTDTSLSILHNIYDYKIDLDYCGIKINSNNPDKFFFEVNNSGTNSVLLINGYKENCFLKTRGRSVLVSINHERYGEYLEHSARVINAFDSYGRIIAFDKEDNKLYVALYNTLTTLIEHTNSIHSYKIYNTLKNTPIRAISNAWRSIQVELGNGSNNNLPNAIAIRLKMNNTNALESDVISKQYTLRYRVLISDVTNGKFILYETEKSVGMSKTDDETRTIEPFLRVLAIDGFEDEIFELYTSKLDNNHKVIVRDNNGNNSLNNNSNYSRDFMTFIQRFTGSDAAKYQIKIECLNTLPSEIDAKFYIEPYFQDATNKAIFRNNIKTSEYLTDMSRDSNAGANKNVNCIFGKNIDGIIAATIKDKLSDVKYPVITNKEHFVQKEQNVEKIGVYADTYMSILRCDGLGTFDKINCIIMADNTSNYVIVPLSKNKKDLRYVFDNFGSKVLNDSSFAKLEFIRNGRTIHKMHNHSVFAKNVVNNPDYYVDYEGKGRIVAIEGTLVNEFGLFESISSVDGNQKRIGQVSEIRDGLKYNNTVSAYDNIKKRNVGYGYDIIDRYSIFESPYDMIKAWWVPAKGYINNGNERLSNLQFDEIETNVVGKKYNKDEYIENFNTSSKKTYIGGKNPVNNGIVSTANGAHTTSDSIEAYTELIDEKFPLENWKGWEWAKMCFIRKWRKVFTDKHIEYLYEVEAPSAAEKITTSSGSRVDITNTVTCTFTTVPYNNEDFAKPEVVRLKAAIKPSFDRQLYYYTDVHDRDEKDERRDTFEGISTESFKRASAWYYKSHRWLVILDEKLVVRHETIFEGDSEKDLYLENKNLARLSDGEFDRIISDESLVNREWLVRSSTDSVNTDNVELLHHDSKYELDNGSVKPHLLDDTDDPLSVEWNRYFNEAVYPPTATTDVRTIGNRIMEINLPLTYEVVDAEISNESISYDNSATSKPSYTKIIRYKLGIDKFGDENNLYGTYVKSRDLLYSDGSIVNNNDLFGYLNNWNDVPQQSLDVVRLKFEGLHESVILTNNTYHSPRDNTTLYSTTVNTYDYNYGIGAIIPYYEEDDKYSTSRTEHHISFRVRQYLSDLGNRQNSSRFIDYKDFVYNYIIKADADNKPVLTLVEPSPDNTAGGVATLEQISGDSNVASLERYCGKATQKYLYSKKFIFKINNLIKNSGYQNVTKELIIWSVKDPIFNNALLEQIRQLRIDSTDATFDRADWRTSVYTDRFSFITFNKDQHYPKVIEDGTGVVDRIFVKQLFRKELNTEKDIQWSRYISLYNKTVATYPNKANNFYPQEYNYLELFNNKLTPELITRSIDSRYCWVHLVDGSLNNKNMFVTTDDDTGLSYNVAGEFCYQWTDGSIKRIQFTLDDNVTLGDLYEKGFITEYSVRTERIVRHENDDYFDKIVTITVTGENLDNRNSWSNSVKSATLFASEILEYAETADTIGDNTDVASTSTWLPGGTSVPETDNGIGMQEPYDGTGIERNETYTVRYDMLNMHPEGLDEVGTDIATRYINYNKKLIANDGYKLPDTINVSIGATGTTEDFVYDRRVVKDREFVYEVDTDLSVLINELRNGSLGVSGVEDCVFDGFSLDGKTILTDTEINTYKISASTYFRLYFMFTSLKEATLTIAGEKIIDNITIYANAIVKE